jgi:protein-disulfide isomerase
MYLEQKLRVPVKEGDHAQGNHSAPVVLVEYGDYQCGFCSRAHQIVKELQKVMGSDLRFIFRNFPLKQIHPFALGAAVASEAADQQDMFWRMHDALYENHDALDQQNVLSYASSLDLDMERFVYDMENPFIEQKIERDFYGGSHSRVNVTPAFFVNGIKYTGDWSFEPFINYLRWQQLKVSRDVIFL